MNRDGTHNHGLLAGVGAGAMAVLVVLVLLLLAWHRIAGAVGTAATVIIWAVVAVVAGAAAYVLLFLAVRARLHVQQPESTAVRYTARAGAVNQPAPPPVSSPSVAELPPGESHIHYHFDGATSAEAAMRVTGSQSDVPR